MRLLIVSAILFIISSNLYAQYGKSTWYIIQDDEDKIVYIDTSKVALREEMLSVWSMTVYRKPYFMNTIAENITKSKTRYLFNVAEKTFSVVGSIYYDTTGQLINTGTSGITGGGSPEFLEVKNSYTLNNLMNKGVEYAQSGRISAAPGEYAAKLQDEVDNTNLNKELLTDKKEEPQKEIVDTPVIPKPETKKPELAAVNPAPVPEIEVEEPEEKEEEEVKSETYDDSKDKVVRGTVFTDGTHFCYQVSSWKRKAKADTEVAKLKNRGFNAYIMEIWIAARKQTWYRVRVGLFDSYEEARADQRRL